MILVILIFISSLVFTSTGHSKGFIEGMEEYNRGNQFGAFRNWYTLAKRGDPECQYGLGLLYREGKAVKQDFKISLKWFLESSEQNFGKATYELGNMYRLGNGVNVDLDRAMRYYKVAFEQGEAAAANAVFDLIEEKRYLDEDHKSWLKNAAENGYPKAQYKLALHHLKHEGQPKKEQIVKLLHDAAIGNVVGAQYDLGHLYYYGNFKESVFVKNDLSKALKYFEMAAASEHRDAKDWVDKIRREREKEKEEEKNLNTTLDTAVASASRAAMWAKTGEDAAKKVRQYAYATISSADAAKNAVARASDAVQRILKSDVSISKKQRARKALSSAKALTAKSAAAAVKAESAKSAVEKAARDAARHADAASRYAKTVEDAVSKGNSEMAVDAATKAIKSSEYAKIAADDAVQNADASEKLRNVARNASVSVLEHYAKVTKILNEVPTPTKPIPVSLEISEENASKLIDQGNYQDAMKVLVRLDASCFVNYLLGRVYTDKKSNLRDIKRGINLLEDTATLNGMKCSGKDDATKAQKEALMALGKFYSDPDTNPNLDKAENYFQDLYKLGESDAAFYIGGIYKTRSEAGEAIEWYKKVKSQGKEYVSSIKSIADLYYHGNDCLILFGYCKDHAYEWYLKAAKLCDRQSMFKVSEMLANGEGVEKNQSLSEIWKQRAENGECP